MRRIPAILVAFLILAGFASAASAQDDILGTIEDFLNRTQQTLDQNRIMGKIRFTPYISQRVIYDDNIWLNDDDENDTRGREWDVISDSTVRLGLVLPVNESYTKLFNRNRLTLLSYEARFLEYMRRGDTDAINQTLKTDLFGFLEDLANVGVQGKNIYFDAGADWSNVSDPVDIVVRDLTLAGFPPQFTLSEIRRTRVQAHALLGYRRNAFDFSTRYDFDWWDFSNDFFRQADQRSHKGTAEVGFVPPFLEDKRVYVRFEYTDLHFRRELLNDAAIREYTLGFEGILFSKKLKFILEGGFLHWDTQSSGLLADDHEYAGGTALARVVFKPWNHRETRFQFEGAREISWSAISNYRVDHRLSLTAFEELMPKKLRADVTVSWAHNVPTDGPVRSLLSAGAGLTYHLFKQVNVEARYLYRIQTARRETMLLSATPGGTPIRIQTDGDFDQNVLSIGLTIEL